MERPHTYGATIGSPETDWWSLSPRSVQTLPNLWPSSLMLLWLMERRACAHTPFDAECILKIPLCTRRMVDFWAWVDDQHGRFSVRSAYNLIMKTNIQREEWLDEQQGISNSTVNSQGWSSIWKLRVPSKLRVFAWRLARQSLPTGDVLHNRNMARPTYVFVSSRRWLET